MPAVVDLAAMRDAMADLGGDAEQDQPAGAGRAGDRPLGPGRRVRHARRVPRQRRARVRAQRGALRVPALGPGRLRGLQGRAARTPASCTRSTSSTWPAWCSSDEGTLYPDTLVGTDSHTTMINGLGVLGWGVGGIEAEAAMLGQPMSMLIPRVVGFKLGGELPEGATATDLVLTVTQMLREHGVVGKFVEFYGPGVPNLPLADRATIGNMSPEFGSTCAIFPIDAETLRYLEFSGRDAERIELVEAYAREQGLWHDEDTEEPTYSETLELDLGDVVPSLAGPKRPQDRVSLTESKAAVPDGARRLPARARRRTTSRGEESFPASDPPAFHRRRRTTIRGAPNSGTGGVQVADRVSISAQRHAGRRHRDRARPRARGDRGDHVVHQHLEPVGDARRRPAGQERRRARAGGQAVGEDLARPGLEGRHRVLRARRPDAVPRAARLPPRRLRLHDVHRQLRPAAGGDLRRGQRRGPRGRLRALGQPQLRGPHQPRREDELPRLAAAVRGLRAGGDDGHRPARRAARAGHGRRGRLPEGHLAERRGGRAHGRGGRAERDVQLLLRRGVRGRRALERARGARGRPLRLGRGLDLRAPAAVLRGHARPSREPIGDIEGARVLALLGDSVTTDHISPAGAIKKDSPAAQVPQRARRRAQGLQLLRLAARQPRGDDARHVREHPPAQPARRQAS